MICPERERLAHEYRVCVDRFRVAVFKLKDLRGPEFEQCYRASERYRVEVDEARVALDRHRHERGC